MPGPTSAATKPRPTRNTPSTTRPTAVRADRWLAGGHRPVQSIAGSGTARSVPRLAGRHGAARQTGPDGLSVLLAGEIASHCDAPLSQRQPQPRPRTTGGEGDCNDRVITVKRL